MREREREFFVLFCSFSVLFTHINATQSRIFVLLLRREGFPSKEKER